MAEPLTTARPPSRSTRTVSTPSTCCTAFSTDPVQWPHIMPSTLSLTSARTSSPMWPAAAVAANRGVDAALPYTVTSFVSRSTFTPCTPSTDEIAVLTVDSQWPHIMSSMRSTVTGTASTCLPVAFTAMSRSSSRAPPHTLASLLSRSTVTLVTPGTWLIACSTVAVQWPHIMPSTLSSVSSLAAAWDGLAAGDCDGVGGLRAAGDDIPEGFLRAVAALAGSDAGPSLEAAGQLAAPAKGGCPRCSVYGCVLFIARKGQTTMKLHRKWAMPNTIPDR